MSIVNSLLKPRLLLPLCLAATLSGLPLPATGHAWLDQFSAPTAFADDDDDDRWDDDDWDDDDWDDRYDDDDGDDDDDDDDRYDDDDDDDDD